MRLDGHQMEFDVKFDRFHRTAIITSAPIEITKAPQVLRIKMNRIPSATGDAMTQKITANTTIESADNIFKISGLETTVADDTSGLPQQLLLINMTSQAAADTKWDKYVEVSCCQNTAMIMRTKPTPHTNGPQTRLQTPY